MTILYCYYLYIWICI